MQKYEKNGKKVVHDNVDGEKKNILKKKVTKKKEKYDNLGDYGKKW